MRIHICGAAGEVTGSGYLVETDKATVLVDFGMFQGTRTASDDNRDLGPVDPKALDAIVLTHAHLDHCGRLPLLVKHGLGCPIYTTPATIDFATLILEDSARIAEYDVERENRHRAEEGKDPIQPLYTPGHVDALAPLYQPVDYDERKRIADGVTVRLVDSGHILGAASIEMTVEENGRTRTVVFSGDVGPRDTAIIRDPVTFDHADLVFLEATYGDRDHRPIDETVEEFQEILSRSIWEREKVLIPSFAVGRAQLILYHIAELIRQEKVPEFPIYLDSPMAIKATELYSRHRDLFDREATRLVEKGQLREDLAGVRPLETAAESRRLNDSWEGCVIIAGSGMCEGGRIVHHLLHNLWRRGVSVIFVGYAVEGSLARRLIEGAREVNVLGKHVNVRAQVHTLGGFSAHAGQYELADWFAPLADSKPRLVLTHGEEKQRRALRELLKHRHGIDGRCPERFDVITLE